MRSFRRPARLERALTVAWIALCLRPVPLPPAAGLAALAVGAAYIVWPRRTELSHPRLKLRKVSWLRVFCYGALGLGAGLVMEGLIGSVWNTVLAAHVALWGGMGFAADRRIAAEQAVGMLPAPSEPKRLLQLD